MRRYFTPITAAKKEIELETNIGTAQPSLPAAFIAIHELVEWSERE